MLKLPAEAHKMVFIRYLLILGATLYSSLSLAQKEISAERKENNESTKNAENIENIENIENKDTISVESKDHVREDPGLLKWLSKYADIASLDSAANKEELIVKEDPLTQTYLHLRFFNLTRDRNRARALALSAIPELVQYSDHPLLPYALREMLESLRKIEDKPSIEIVQNFLENHVWSSCPTSQFFKSSLTQKDFLINDSQKVPKYLEKLSLTQKNLQNTLDYILKIIPREKRPFFKKNLYPFVKDYPALAKKFTWLNDQSSPGTLSESFKYLIKLGKSFTLNDCENHFLKFKKDLASMREITFEAMTERSELIETCFKAKGAKHAIKFWKDFLPQLELAFGLQGKLYSYYRTSYLLWNMDHHDQAKQVLQEILALYGKHENFVVFDKSFYLLARIVENEEKFDEAIAHYKYFIENFPHSEKIDQALSSLVILHVGLKKWAGAKEYAEKIILKQDHLPVDKRDSSTLGFSLFWLARVLIELGHKELAVNQWQRLSKELFSTYYGALGHAMLEEASGQRYVLQPEKTALFNQNSVYDSFPIQEQSKIKMILKLLSFGFKDEASCEIAQLNSSQLNPEQSVMKSLLLHASGNWLDSIKLFSEVPRSLRQRLPLGMERLLFPKKFEWSVSEYSSKLKLDPALVLSVIRQESVFNPKAKSFAGARGLMQLMDKTALMQARILGNSYVSSHMKTQIIHQTRDPVSLYESELNIILGVHYLKSLLQKYDDPILSLSAYNAGPIATAKWSKKYTTKDLLYFIELIPYPETRSYVKLVLRNYFYYKRWYGNESDDFSHLQYIISQNISANFRINKPLVHEPSK